GWRGRVPPAHVPWLDRNSPALLRVSRRNSWLVTHVLTEVSSYGALLMAAMLGLTATGFYLTATSRRSPTFAELALPLVPGLPLLAVGGAGWVATQGQVGPSWEAGGALP